MSGIKTNLLDLGKAFDKFKGATLAEETRKNEKILELKRQFEAEGFSPWMAANLAGERYNQIHKR